MKLLNYTLKYLSITLLLLLSVWALLFYFSMVEEIQDSLDDGLENNKMLVIKRVGKDIGIVERSGFSEHNYDIRELRETSRRLGKDVYLDTLMWTLNDEEMEPFRMLKTVFEVDGKHYEMKVVASAVGKEDMAKELLYSLIFLYIAIVTSGFLINNFLIRKIWTPFYRTLNNLREFKIDKGTPIEATTSEVREFRELNRALVELSDHAIDAYRKQKQFIENAAHELQTPLAISLNKLELLAEDDALADHQLEAIGKVMSTLQRLTRLNKSLLLLTRIENRQYGKIEATSMKDLVKALVSEYQDYATSKGVTIQLDLEQDMVLNVNKDLAAIMISNLLKNAIVHNHDGGSVRLLLSKNTFSISNTGIGKPLDEQLIFNRFEKYSADKNSSGMGLAIVNAIVRLYNYRISYSYGQQLHHFMILFKH